LQDPRTALGFAEEAVERSGGEVPYILDTLALAFHRTGENESAVEVERRAVAGLSPDDLQGSLRRDLEYNLVRFHLGREDVDAAVRILDERLARNRRQLQEGDLGVCQPLYDQAVLLVDEGQYALAEPRAREALDLFRRASAGDRRWRTARAEALYGRCLAGLGRFAEAEALLLEAYESLEGIPLAGVEEAQGQALGWIVRLYEDWGKPDEAARWAVRRDSPR
jgi:tetratricopeptide (TPR) repeat protein